MNIVIWIQAIEINGGVLETFVPALNILNRQYGIVNVLGAVIPSDGEISLNGIKPISKENLVNINFDLILVTGIRQSEIVNVNHSGFVEVLKETTNLGIDPDKVIPDRVVCIPLFKLEKYKKLRRSQLSIFSMNCFGGIVYNRLGLPFLSPTINMFTPEEHFLKFLEDPIETIKKQLIFQRTEFEGNLKINYPVFKIGEVEWHMNHYADFEYAFKKWYMRSYRINWFNILVTMYTENPEILAKFDKLPYFKKVCFVPFKSDLDSAYSVDISKYDNGELWLIVNHIANGNIIEYDIWDMLLYGKKTLLRTLK